MNVVFLGTPEFAVPVLEGIFSSKHKVLAVISQPDREIDKKGQLIETPVKKTANRLNIPVLQFERISSKEGIEAVKALNADVMITVAFGQLLSQEFLDVARMGVFNAHASILPQLRGSSPIQSAILNGLTESGVTIMKTVLKMDAGDIYKVAKTPIDDTTTFKMLHDTLSLISARLVIELLDELESGTAKGKPQDESKATYTKKLTKADGLIDFNESGKSIVRKINAFNPWPSAYTTLSDLSVKIHSARFIEGNFNAQNGTILMADSKKGLTIKCSDGAIEVLTIQVAGKKSMSAEEFLRGKALIKGNA